MEDDAYLLTFGIIQSDNLFVSNSGALCNLLPSATDECLCLECLDALSCAQILFHHNLVEFYIVGKVDSDAAVAFFLLRLDGQVMTVSTFQKLVEFDGSLRVIFVNLPVSVDREIK